jgi:REP element-mobilizing transposase RayT
MKDFTQYHHRRSTRLLGYDYSQEGMFFITICTHEKQWAFGYIDNAMIYLNETGVIANNCWMEIPNHYPNVVLHDFIVMPDHIHGIIELVNNPGCRENNGLDGHTGMVGVQDFEPLQQQFFEPLQHQCQQHEYQKIIPRSIGSIIRGYKIGVTKWFRENQKGTRIWQRNYYEHVIRNEDSYQLISQYIINNPGRWID